MAKPWIFLADLMLVCVPALLIAPPRVAACATETASVESVRYWATDEYLRVIIDLDSDAQFENARLTSPDRIYFDIFNARLGKKLIDRIMIVGDEFLERVRIAQNRPDLVRIVLDISEVDRYSISELQNPFRIVVDLYGMSGKRTATDLLTRASIPRPDEIGSIPSSKPVLAAVQAVPQAPEPLTAPNTDKNSPETVIVEPSQDQPAAAIAESSAPEEIEPSTRPPQPDVAMTQFPSGSTAAETLTRQTELAASKQDTSSHVQELPLTITGNFYTGFYSSYTRGGGNPNQTINFVPAGGTFDINGYYLTPDFLKYWVQPELNAAPQAGDAGFLGGNGIRMRVDALPKSAVATSFRYSNVELKDVYFGSLAQVSSYTLNNRSKEMGVTAELKPRGLPVTTIDWGTSSVYSEAFISEIPDYLSHSDHLNLTSVYQLAGWNLRGFASGQQQVSDLYSPEGQTSNSSVLRQKVRQYNGSANRSFLQDSELLLDAGSQSTANDLLDQPIDLTTRFASAHLRLLQRRRWKTSLRAAYTSNIASLLATRLVSDLSSNGSIAPDTTILQPFQHTTSYLNFSGMTSLDLSHGLGLYGSADRIRVLTALDSALSSTYFTATAGITYAKAFGWGSFSGQYGRIFGNGSVIGQAGRIEGQNYVVTVQPGNWERLQLDFSARGTDQRIINELPTSEHSFASDGSMGIRLLGQLRARIGGGWQQSNFATAGNVFHTGGYTARAGIELPRLQLNGFLNSSTGNSPRAFDQTFSGIGVGSALLTPLNGLVPSDFQGITINLHVIPLRRLELTANYTRSMQHLAGTVANDFEIIDVYVTYHFRRLEFVTGYFDSVQTYTSYLAPYPETQRGRFYIRITRSARLL